MGIETKKFQGRGIHYFAKLNPTTSLPGAFSLDICTDTSVASLATTSFEHTSKCGPVDVVDYRGIKAVSGTIKITFANVADMAFAFASLGLVKNGVAGTVASEDLPENMVAGNSWFLGGIHSHRNITGLTIAGVVLDTDYSLNVQSGQLTVLQDFPSGPISADYSYTDPKSVPMLIASSDEYMMRYQLINKADALNPGSVEFYRVRFDPAQTIDLQSDELQIIDLTGSLLANAAIPITDQELGQFGRRILAQ